MGHLGWRMKHVMFHSCFYQETGSLDDNDALQFILLGIVIVISNGMLVPLNCSHVPWHNWVVKFG